MTDRTEREIPATKPDRGMTDVDDHRVEGSGQGGATQPIEGMDEGVATEHLGSPSQGVRPEPVSDDEAVGGGPDGDEASGSGPMFEEPA